MKTHVLRAGFLFLCAVMLIVASGCNSKDDSKVTSGVRRGIPVKVKASKF